MGRLPNINFPVWTNVFIYDTNHLDEHLHKDNKLLNWYPQMHSIISIISSQYHPAPKYRQATTERSAVPLSRASGRIRVR